MSCVGLVERQRLGDAFELDGSERVEPQKRRRVSRGGENPAWRCNPNLIYAFYRFVASGSTSEPEIFWQGRNGPLLGKQVFGVVSGADEPHDHGSSTSDLG